MEMVKLTIFYIKIWNHPMKTTFYKDGCLWYQVVMFLIEKSKEDVKCLRWFWKPHTSNYISKHELKPPGSFDQSEFFP